MKRFVLAVILMICASPLWLHAGEDDTFRPVYQLNEKQKFVYDLDLTYEWGPLTAVSDNRQPVGKIQEGVTSRFRTQFVQIIQGSEGQQVTFDLMYKRLKQVTEKGKELFLPGTKAVKNKKFVFTIEPDGTLKLVESWKNYGGLPGGIQFAVELKDAMFRFYPEFPAGDLKVGSTWARKIKGSDFGSNEDLALNYKILGVEKFQNHRCMKIEVKGTIKADYRIDDPMGEFFAQIKSEGDLEGICHFSHIKGLPVGFSGRADKKTVINTEWVRGDDTGRKQVNETTTGIQYDLKLSTGGS
jgi:hypothetical protein